MNEWFLPRGGFCSRGAAVTLICLAIAGVVVLSEVNRVAAQERPESEAKDGGAKDGAANDGDVADEKLERDVDKKDASAKLFKPESVNPIEKLLVEVQDNMKSIEELLNQRDTGASTQGAAEKAMKSLDELIIELQKQAQSQSSSSSSQQQSSNRKQQSSQDQKQSQDQQKMQREGQEKKPGQEEPKDNQEVPNERTSEGELPPESSTTDPNNPRAGGIWGRMPKRDVEQVFDNGRNAMPEKYRILLEEYYGGRASRGGSRTTTPAAEKKSP